MAAPNKRVSLAHLSEEEKREHKRKRDRDYMQQRRTETISVTLSKETGEQLDMICQRLDINRPAAVDLAVSEYIQRHQPSAPKKYVGSQPFRRASRDVLLTGLISLQQNWQ